MRLFYEATLSGRNNVISATFGKGSNRGRCPLSPPPPPPPHGGNSSLCYILLLCTYTYIMYHIVVAISVMTHYNPLMYGFDHYVWL